MSLRSDTGSFTVSPNDSTRGTVGRRTSGSRTRVVRCDEPKWSPAPAPPTATAITRSAPWNSSGSLKTTRARPAPSAVSRPDQKATGSTRRMLSVRTVWAAPSSPSPPPAAPLPSGLTSGSSRLKVS